MITSVLALSVAPQDVGALEELYARRGILERSLLSPGCRGASLLRATAPGATTHLVIAEWDDEAAYATWVADPWRATVTHELSALLLSDPAAPVVAQTYATVLDRSPDRPAPEEIP